MTDGTGAVERAVADAHRREWAFVLAATARVAGDFDLAEECVQEAYVAALDAWARDGIPRKQHIHHRHAKNQKNSLQLRAGYQAQENTLTYFGNQIDDP